jgi:pyruvate,water dikinase
MVVEAGVQKHEVVSQAPPPGSWARESSHFPLPQSPAYREFFGWFTQIWASLAREHGMMIDGLAMCEIDGWAYQRVVPLGGKERKAPPPWMMRVLVRTAPSIRARVRDCIASTREDRAMRPIEKWYGGWRDEQAATIASMRGTDLPALSDAQLASAIDEVYAFARSSLERHFALTVPLGTVAELVFFLEDVLGWDERDAIALLSGLSTASTAPAKALQKLAAMARRRPAVQDLLEEADAATLRLLRDTDPEFAAAVDAYHEEFGFRALRYDPIDPMLSEAPELTLGLIRDQLKRGYDEQRERARRMAQREAGLARAREQLLRKSAADQAEFERLLGRAERYYPVREENEFTTISVPTALARQRLLEAGRRLSERGQIDSAEDVFMLTRAEITSGLVSGTALCDAARTRGAERARSLANPGPDTYGPPPPDPPPAGVFPREAARNLRGVFWATERVFGTARAPHAKEARSITGVAASPGRYEGRVRVIMGEREFGKIEAGDVLVCPITSPVWSVLFASVGALVTDSGGILSHPAIIAREYGVPAVVSTGNGTEVLSDGQLVCVDGSSGTVTAI